ncbi:MAG TPA: alkaline phosphatase family protein [Streptosporangiaceae bacterium]|nr:alkaline phosphatase family protein [Streptosporangiaceae bacterium]
MGDRNDLSNSNPYPRRRFLQQAGAAGVAAPLLVGANTGVLSYAERRRIHRAEAATPIKHIVVCCQENHSFDTYFGKYAGLPAGFSIPPGYSNPNGSGGVVKPFHFSNLEDNGTDPNHDWTSTHSCVDGGKMDGFARTNGKNALGYYEAVDLPYYYSLFPKYTLCANYFCGVLSMTYPNRLVLYSGTSGGITTNNINTNGSLSYPCILDNLSSHGITFKNYNFHAPANYSILALFKKWATGGPSNELNQSISQFMSDCANNTLPQVSFITEAPPYDEHPTANVRTGESMIKSIVTAVQKSAAWSSTAILVTYDEGGGFFDHIAPPKLDAFGPGIRVPMIVVSPLAKAGHVDTTASDHSSVLKFIETVFSLPTMASLNHQFDSHTPTGFNYEGNGAPFPPRDGNSALSDLTQCFTFG